MLDLPFSKKDKRRFVLAPKVFSLLLGIPDGVFSGGFIAETPIDADTLDYTYRENAPSRRHRLSSGRGDAAPSVG